jgi:tetratricopeptide (TPR) repeat protein
MWTERNGHWTGPQRLEHLSADHDWFAIGCDLEEDEHFHEAARAYRRAIHGPARSPSAHFNLANCLYKMRRKIEAAEQYRLALQLDAQCREAWNNLGVVLCELQQCDDAVWAYHRAITLAPWHGDAFYNLADCFDDRGVVAEAQRYWREYLRFDSDSEWAEYARSRLGS